MTPKRHSEFLGILKLTVLNLCSEFWRITEIITSDYSNLSGKLLTINCFFSRSIYRLSKNWIHDAAVKQTISSILQIYSAIAAEKKCKFQELFQRTFFGIRELGHFTKLAENGKRVNNGMFWERTNMHQKLALLTLFLFFLCSYLLMKETITVNFVLHL